jgi:hypothetical protein
LGACVHSALSALSCSPSPLAVADPPAINVNIFHSHISPHLFVDTFSTHAPCVPIYTLLLGQPGGSSVVNISPMCLPVAPKLFLCRTFYDMFATTRCASTYLGRELSAQFEYRKHVWVIYVQREQKNRPLHF